MSNEYRVRWEIDIEADSPEEAAARALIVQRDNDPANTATVFYVRETDPQEPEDDPEFDGWEVIDLSHCCDDDCRSYGCPERFK